MTSWQTCSYCKQNIIDPTSYEVGWGEGNRENMDGKNLKTELEIEDSIHAYLHSTSTCVQFHKAIPFVVFVNQAKEGWVVILAITTLTCNVCCHFEKKNGIFYEQRIPLKIELQA